MISYKLTGAPALIYESKHRVAQLAEDVGCWELFQKVDRNRPISDWDYEDLIYLISVPEGREEVVLLWVESGRIEATDLVFDRRSKLRQQEAEICKRSGGQNAATNP